MTAGGKTHLVVLQSHSSVEYEDAVARSSWARRPSTPLRATLRLSKGRRASGKSGSWFDRLTTSVC